MPVHMGIMYERCRKVHFIATSPGIKLSERVEGMYRLTCKPHVPNSGSSEEMQCTPTGSQTKFSRQGMQN
jgi:hypothetical protein